MTTYDRFVIDDGVSICLSDLEYGLRATDDSYRLNGDAILRGDHDCAILVDVSHRGSDIFDGDIDLLIGFAENRRDSDAIISRLKKATCMVTMQLVSNSDKSAMEHVFAFLRKAHTGLTVYEGGIFDLPEPPPKWIDTIRQVVRRLSPHKYEDRGKL
ncbi:hypothetical protein [Novipirellula caenicola]|uniref:Uncharacterized protein n=1 Tax=Novipirellula caenicola TaxID=1536901 RepID=A0ABP9VVP6_9BACT